MSYTSSVLKETRTAYPSRAPGFPPDFWWVRVAKLFYCLCCVLFCWIYLWILFPNAWINHNLNAVRCVVFSPLICQLHFYKYISYYTINFQKIILKSILYTALIIKKNDYKAELNALLLHNSNTILILILEYQGNLISPQRQYNDTTFVKQTIQVCV